MCITYFLAYIYSCGPMEYRTAPPLQRLKDKLNVNDQYSISSPSIKYSQVQANVDFLSLLNTVNREIEYIM